MRIEQMQDFIEISRSASLAAAARSLYVTPQALSSSIGKMEKELGVKLLVRGQFGIELTKEGKIFLETSLNVMKEYEKGIRKMHHENGQLSGSLEIYGNLVFQNVLLPRFLRDFSRRYPELNIRTSTKNRKSAYEAMMSETEGNMAAFFGRMQVQGRYLEMEAPLDNVDIYPVLTGKLTACVAAGSPLANYKTLSLKTIASYPIILFGMEGQKDYEQLFADYGKIRILLQTDSISGWRQALQDQYGIALIQDNVLSRFRSLDWPEDHDGCTAIQISEEVLCDVCMMTPKTHSPVVQEVIRYFTSGSDSPAAFS